MVKLSGKILEILGWKITSDFPDLDKSVVIFAPHTSYWDAFYGKLLFSNLGINYKFLSKKELFIFPLSYVLNLFGSIPVSKNKEYINEIVDLFNEYDKLHIIISPEGQLAKTNHWKKGFYYMANSANVPIVIGYIDYYNKELGLKGIIYDTKNMNDNLKEISNMYKGVIAKYPNDFSLDKRYS